ncbi:TM2 domain-containing protein [Candidatus Laterigemmans baculatus]|uniref:TM2 domain-containing protein n=1 Tax=Candidatus Laterigemmans baculatus TaxID=2770505 RepID=UPI0013D9B4D2|nr:TM2 domain-containing protein [Candidatus Laterigemmans baculatus]
MAARPAGVTDPSRQAEPTHPALIGYIFWILGFTGAHRFYFGRPLTGILWFFTGGLLLIGWIVDLFLIPSMADVASRRYAPGRYDYSVAWLLQVFLGIFGIHRFYLGKIISGVVWLLTGGLFGLGYIYDMLTLNEQIEEANTAP